MKYQVIEDYVLEYENPYDDYVSLTIWKVHKNDILPFSEVISHIFLEPTHKPLRIPKVIWST